MGSDSFRALLVNTTTGKEVATAVCFYRRWKVGKYCESSKNKFRQHPLDYIEGVENTTKSAVSQVNEVVVKNIVGIGIDTTGSTPVAVDKTGTPLALLNGSEENPNAMFVLCKDHTGYSQNLSAEQLRNFAEMMDIEFLLIDEKTDLYRFKQLLRWNEIAFSYHRKF